MIKKMMLLLGLLASASVMAQNEPWRNPACSPEERADDLTKRLTLKEKIGLMKDVSQPVERLGIPAYNWWSEALHGVGRAGTATVFPQAIGMAATFDDALVERIFTAVSDEARAKFHEGRREGRHTRYRGLTFWTPNINIFRDPRWGRGQETYGEDPWLTTRMGLAAVRGLQGPDTARYDKLHACAKHFAVHSGPEWNRHQFDARDIDPRDLWETYLPAFKALVKEGNVAEVMCAYNRYEGEPCCGNRRLLTWILRELWGYKGLVVSDCGAVSDFHVEGRHNTHRDAAHASADAVLSGTDVECGSNYSRLDEAVEQGLIDEKQIDVSVRRLLRARFALGELDDDRVVPWSRIPVDVIDCEEHRALALEAARRSIVLLQNRGGILPLKRDEPVVVLGVNAADSVMQWGNYNGFPSHTITLLEGIRRMTGREVRYLPATGLVDNRVFVSVAGQIVGADGHSGFDARYWNTTEAAGEPAARQATSGTLRFDSSGATVFAPGVELENFSARYTGTFRPERSGEVILRIKGDDAFRMTVDGKTVVDRWGEKRRSSAQTTLTVEAGRDYPIAIDFRQYGGNALLQFDLGYESVMTPEEVVAAVGDVQTVIYAGGISPALEGEEMKVDYPGFRGGDRTEIELPAAQRRLIEALHKAGKRIIMVNYSGSAIALEPESHRCDAILQAWYPGQSGGQAVAEVLYGEQNPAGRLPVTFYRSAEQLPDFEDYSMEGRTYRFMTEEPLYPFGHGLSYTTFDYGKVRLSRGTIKAGDAVKLSVGVRNAGDRDGDEVLQIYVHRVSDNGLNRTLRAFRREHLRAGERREVEFLLPASAFEFFDEKTQTVRVQKGRYEIYCGGSSTAQNKVMLEIR